MVKTDVVEGPVERVTRGEIVEAMQKMKSGKAAEPLKVGVKTIVVSGEIGIKGYMRLCQRVLDEREMHDEGKISGIVHIFKGKGDVINCGLFSGAQLPEYAIKIEGVGKANTITDQVE